MPKDKESALNLSRIRDAASLSPSIVAQAIASEAGLDDRIDEIRVGHKVIPFIFDYSGLSAKKFATVDEVAIANDLHAALLPARQAAPKLLRDPEVWAWIGLVPLRNYVVNRWCGGYLSNGWPTKVSSCSYFLTSDSLVRQARCGVRRLWIAASTSHRVDGDGRYTAALLDKADLYTGIFERMIGLDPEMAVEIAVQSHQESEEVRRDVIRVIGQVLSTTILETLTREDKRELVAECLLAAKSLN